MFDLILAVAAEKAPRPNAYELYYKFVQMGHYSPKSNRRDCVMQLDKYIEFVEQLEKVLSA